jgi:acyl transferase domain-containing protein
VREPIAIVGLGVRFPGAGDPEAYWRLLASGESRIGETPRDRYDAASLYDPDPGAPGKIVTTKGAFLEGIDLFDAEAFAISEREAASIDPQQRLLLEVTSEALDDAGIPAQKIAGSRTAVMIALGPDDYPRIQLSKLEHIGANTLAGNAVALAANRLSYSFDLRGPSFVVDSACSSSLVAVHLAIRSLECGEASLAIAGGACLLLQPELTVVASKAGALSPEGTCRPFDARASGYVRGEGVGVVILKPLSLAIADRDPIRALIVGSGVAQNGRTNGVTAPSRWGQEAAIGAALESAGIRPSDVQYVEAHGTGTPIGDLIEASALGAVFGPGRPSDRPLLVGSVKSNLGNLEAASGIASLIKVALAIETRAVPGMPSFESPSPSIAFSKLGLEPSARLRPWPPHEGPLRAGVSGFGLGGANVHLVLEEAPAPDRAASDRKDAPILVTLSARTSEDLEARARAVLERIGSLAIEDVAWSLGARSRHFSERLAVIVRSTADLEAALSAWLAGSAEIAGLFRGRAPKRLPKPGSVPIPEDLEGRAKLYLAGHDPAQFMELPAARFVKLPGAAKHRKKYWSAPAERRDEY